MLNGFLTGLIVIGFLSMLLLGYAMWKNIKNVLHPLHSLKKLTAVDLCADQVPPANDQSNE